MQGDGRAREVGGREDGALDSIQSLSFFKEGGLKGARLVARERRGVRLRAGNWGSDTVLRRTVLPSLLSK